MQLEQAKKEVQEIHFGGNDMDPHCRDCMKGLVGIHRDPHCRDSMKGMIGKPTVGIP